ncbi:hypothetical protein MAR_027172 [Mya arenaria]|uniref:Uncharacterized protein n=1 Tax=Mya arenaria TaxID=6604 RepID=A0ABY7EUS9_MYAAR|nr:hypothetical protein MAR_027172 [Mya arenaria]
MAREKTRSEGNSWRIIKADLTLKRSFSDDSDDRIHLDLTGRKSFQWYPALLQDISHPQLPASETDDPGYGYTLFPQRPSKIMWISLRVEKAHGCIYL